MKLSDPNVKVTQETITRYYNNNGYYDAVTGSTTLDNVNYQYENGNLTMTLQQKLQSIMYIQLIKVDGMIQVMEKLNGQLLLIKTI